jgi:hypothetical protein
MPNKSLQFVILVGVLNLVSSVLFLFLWNRPVYDDQYNISDVRTYAKEGVSVLTIRTQKNPPGPVGFIWMGSAVRLFGDDELFDARIAVLSSWIILVVGLLLAARRSEFPNLWYGALLATLVFPHSVTATATLLTEGPSLAFAVLGVLLWSRSISRPDFGWSSLAVGTIGALSMGLAAACRQYFVALLPAAATFVLYLSRKTVFKNKPLWTAGATFSLGVAALPLVVLLLIWKGITSPGMATGASYSNWKASAGLSPSRPIVASLYIVLYLLPFTFPAITRIRPAWRWRMLLLAFVGGVLAARFQSSLLQPGPLHSAIGAAMRIPLMGLILFGLIVAVAIYNCVACVLLLWERKSSILSCPPVVLSLLAVGFFILEQCGVGGNLPLYERYILQVAPFLGLIAFWILPTLDTWRTLALVAMSLIGHIMLWRYAQMNLRHCARSIVWPVASRRTMLEDTL